VTTMTVAAAPHGLTTARAASSLPRMKGAAVGKLLPSRLSSTRHSRAALTLSTSSFSSVLEMRFRGRKAATIGGTRRPTESPIPQLLPAGAYVLGGSVVYPLCETFAHSSLSTHFSIPCRHPAPRASLRVCWILVGDRACTTHAHVEHKLLAEMFTHFVIDISVFPRTCM
jgi:hypothetical protein